jgi:hypothetical protein
MFKVGSSPSSNARRSAGGLAKASRHQAQVRFVDEAGGIEGLPGLLVGQLLGSQTAQLLVDQRQELAGSLRIALVDGGQNLGDFSHDRRRFLRASILALV